MAHKRFDVVVIGSGPAGSIAALVLARGGARVALVDKAAFPRAKACGDLIGPRGVQLLRDLAIDVPEAARVSDMLVVGPSGRRVRLPARSGRTYPGYGIVVERSCLDSVLQRAAIEAGAELFEGRAGDPLFDDGRLRGFSVSAATPREVCVEGDVIVGADGASSHVADVAGLVDVRRVLWGFAVRDYLEEPVPIAHIMFWTPTRFAGFPGYGWVFPAGAGRVNIGLGVGVLADRSTAGRASRDLDAFVEHACRVGVLSRGKSARASARPLGGWLKMGVVGTSPAKPRVLLVGDAAGLVNPLQGEGIAQAMASGRAAATAILDGVDSAPDAYRAYVARTHGRYLSMTAAVQRSMLRSPRRVAVVTRLLTQPVVGAAVAGGWSILWNDLVEGATPSVAATVATAASNVGQAATARSADRQWIAANLER